MQGPHSRVKLPDRLSYQDLKTRTVSAGSGSRPALAILAVLGWTLFLSASHCSAASNFKVLHGFGSGRDGGDIQSSVTVDKKGHVYGTTHYGGTGGYGTVFKLSQKPNGSWSEKILQNFSNNDPNGQEPLAPVILDSAGNLYGTTVAGGANHGGTVYEMTHAPSGWNFQVLYDFCSQPDCSDGGGPWAGLVFDKAGNLYGTAFNLFELTPGPTGWNESVLYNFCSQPECSDGRVPYEGVILDAEGNLYGVTHLGGDPTNGGVVYKAHPRPDGTWAYHVLHRFHGPPDDGDVPSSAMLIARDGGGSLYGTTNGGGRYICVTGTCGVVFKMTQEPDGHWKETILHDFKSGKSGYWPGGGVVIDGAGNLYGTTGAGGDINCDCGVVYKMAPNGDGSYTYTVLHRFKGIDGLIPNANLVMDDKGILYGTTQYGGPGGGGVVFMLTP